MLAPTLFDSKCNHRVVHFFPEYQPRDFDKIEDLLADATRAAREGFEAFGRLPRDEIARLDLVARTVRDAVAKRRLLDETFRDALRALLHALARFEPDDRSAEVHDRASRRLRDALNGSERVEDLIAAEREIGRARGIRLGG